MAEFTEDDVTRLTMWLGEHPPGVATPRQRAYLLLEQGVQMPPPPPDPAVVVAEALWRGMGNPDDVPCAYVTWPECLAAVRDLFTSEALAQAAAKVQEADRGK